MKRMLLILMCLATVAGAKTDIFGDSRIASAYFGADTLVLEGGFTPIQDGDKTLDWGVRALATYDDDNVTEEHLRVDDWYVGAWIKYPFMTFDSIFPALPVAGSTYAGVSLMGELDSDTDLFVIPEIGVDIEISEHISGRLAWQYTRREEIFNGDNSKILAGVAVRW